MIFFFAFIFINQIFQIKVEQTDIYHEQFFENNKNFVKLKKISLLIFTHELLQN